MKYQPPFGSLDPNASWVNGNPATGVLGSIPGAPVFEEPQREIVNAIIAAGLVPLDTALNQLTQAIVLLGRIPFCYDQGIANQVVINPVPPLTAYGAALQPSIFAIQIGFTCADGGCTLNVSGLGPLPLTRVTGSPLVATDLVQGGIVIVGENTSGTGFQLLSVPGSLAEPPPQALWHYGEDIGSTNHLVVNIESIGASIPKGFPIGIKVGHANTSATVDVTVNGLQPLLLTRGAGGGLAAGDIAVSYIALMMSDGSEFQLINVLNGMAGGAGGNDITGPDRPYWLSVNSATVTSPPVSPSLGDTYLIPSSATDGWSGLGGRLSQWNGLSWVYRSYPTGSFVMTSDTLQLLNCVAPATWQLCYAPTSGRLAFFAGL